MDELTISQWNQITAEIKILKHQTALNIIEIGKRLKQVRETTHEDRRWYEWLDEEVDIDHSTATRMIQAFEQFGDNATSHGLSTSKVFEMLSLPGSVDRREFIEQPHVIPSTGEIKTVDDMTVKELREVKRKLKQEQEAREAAEQQGIHVIEVNRKLRDEITDLKRQKNPEPKIIEKTVEVPPADYDQLRSKNQEMNTKIARLSGDMDSIRRDYERKLRDVQDGDVKANRRELQRLLSEQLKALDWNHSSALFVFQRLGENAEAVRAVRDFMNEYQEAVRKQLADWQNAISLNTKEEVSWETV